MERTKQSLSPSLFVAAGRPTHSGHFWLSETPLLYKAKLAQATASNLGDGAIENVAILNVNKRLASDIEWRM